MSEYIVEIHFDNFKDAAIYHGCVDRSKLRSKIELNENQQIVLEYLENTFVKSDNAPIVNFSAFGWKHFGAELPTDVEEAYKQMNGQQDLQVLQAFAEWGMKEVAE